MREKQQQQSRRVGFLPEKVARIRCADFADTGDKTVYAINASYLYRHRRSMRLGSYYSADALRLPTMASFRLYFDAAFLKDVTLTSSAAVVVSAGRGYSPPFI